MNFDPDRAAAYLEQGLWNNDTLSGWLSGHAARTPDAPALISSSKTLSYAELKNDVDRLAYGLTGLGLVKGDVVAVQLPNIPEFLTTYLAIASFGGLMQTIHMPYGRSDIEFLLGHSGARVVISLAAAGIPYSLGLLVAGITGMMAGARAEIWLERRAP